MNNKVAKSFDSLQRDAEGRLTLNTPEQAEISKLKEEIEELKRSLAQEKSDHLQTKTRLAGALRGIEARDKRQPLGFFCPKTRVVSDHALSGDDIEVFTKFDPFLYMSKNGRPEDAKKDKERGKNPAGLPRTANDWDKH